MAIILYTRQNHLPGKLTAHKLKTRNLSYHLIKLEKEPTIATSLNNRGYTQTPIVEVTGKDAQIWTGYRPDLIDQLAATTAHTP